MKRYFIILVLFTLFSASLFSQTETGGALGYGHEFAFNNFSVNENKITSFVQTPGVTLSAFRFYNDNIIGIFINSLCLGFPQNISYTNNGINEEKKFDYAFQVEMTIGPAFRLYITDKLIFQPGIGINFGALITGYKEFIPFYNQTVTFGCINYDIGIGCDIGLRYRITKDIIINIGTAITYNFFRFIDLEASDRRLTSRGMARDYHQFKIRPYISLGMNLYWDENWKLIK